MKSIVTFKKQNDGAVSIDKNSVSSVTEVRFNDRLAFSVIGYVEGDQGLSVHVKESHDEIMEALKAADAENGNDGRCHAELLAAMAEMRGEYAGFSADRVNAAMEASKKCMRK